MVASRMQAGPLVTVAVVSWNTRDLLRRCLESFASEVDSGRCEVWVVDNASSDGSAELVRDEFPWVRLHASQENLGFGPAINWVARQTTAPWLGIANADVALQPGAIDALLAAAEGDPGAGAVAPRLVLPDGSSQHSVFTFPTIASTLVVATGVGRVVKPIGEATLLVGMFDADRPRRVPWAIAAFLLVRREAWDAIGGFDEHQWMYAEDLDIGWRLRQAGWATRYEPRARVEHESSASTEQAWGDSGKTERWQRSTYAWMLRRMGAPRTRAVAGIQIAGLLVRLLWLEPLARVAGGRWRRRRDAARWWISLHRSGLARRAELEAHR
jgi:N-acetylglucosaminyl-diphospho-decaprenol L-rhamnosyltransferase